ncbi:MAG: ABC transporter permease [Capsulimonas sp.]|uniref:ABC transporter permease n=1 Tax=Capsulimonas sp. TaxID=2494211 RepID=UPI003264999C
MTALIITGLLITGVRLATPLLLAALGEVMAERAGVINVGIEGMVLAGALAGFSVSYHTHSPWLGLLAAIVAGAALALLFALFAVRLRADQVITGTAINILALGLTGVFFRAQFSQSGASAVVFEPLAIPALHKLPIIGVALFEQNVLGYLSWLLVPACALFLSKTVAGLRLRATGEYPEAAAANGVRVARVRTLAIVWGGALAGLAGAYLSIAYTNGFVENMSAGRGFIALAVVILGRWRPAGVLIAALLFGLASALQYQFQATASHIPYQFFLALPYLLTLAALLLRGRGRFAAPAALGDGARQG